MANSSDILNSIYPSPTKRVLTLVGASSTSYSATSPVKVTVTIPVSGASVTIDGVGYNNSGMIDYYLGSGQSTTVSTSSGGAILSISRVS